MSQLSWLICNDCNVCSAQSDTRQYHFALTQDELSCGVILLHKLASFSIWKSLIQQQNDTIKFNIWFYAQWFFNLHGIPPWNPLPACHFVTELFIFMNSWSVFGHNHNLQIFSGCIPPFIVIEHCNWFKICWDCLVVLISCIFSYARPATSKQQTDKNITHSIEHKKKLYKHRFLASPVFHSRDDRQQLYSPVSWAGQAGLTVLWCFLLSWKQKL